MAMSPLRKVMQFFMRILVDKNKELIYGEAEFLGGFMHRLMKQKNTGTKWTKEEKRRLIRDVRHLSYYVPVLIIFLLPGGSLILPLLAELLDRRKKPRMTSRRVSVSPDR
jgi:hypothetical protein